MSKKRLWLLLLLLLISAGLVIHDRLTTHSVAAVEAVPRHSAAVQVPQPQQGRELTTAEPTAMLPTLRDRSDFAAVNVKGDRLFAGARPPSPPVMVTVPAPPAPVAPPLPFKLLGRKLEQGKWEIYLGKGDRTYITHEGEVIEDTYKVALIRPPVMTLVFLPLNEQQNLQIGADPSEE